MADSMFSINRLFELAREASRSSPDPETQVGCVIISSESYEILSSGCNDFPSNSLLRLDARLERPEKYVWLEHAERNAIYRAAARGVSIRGSMLFVSGGYPCINCARAISACGITKVFAERRGVDFSRWNHEHEMGKLILREAAVDFILLD